MIPSPEIMNVVKMLPRVSPPLTHVVLYCIVEANDDVDNYQSLFFGVRRK